ncbi:hypothetical protein TNCV_3629091 [Trichonephila clavipes]|nr:hypothetical protein TNCV_3629091 [Trichonephila clavipes]
MTDYEQLLAQFINLPSTFPESRYLFLEQRHIGGYQSSPGSFTYRIIIRHGRCRFSASWKSIDLGRDRSRNLVYRRPVTNQPRHPADTNATYDKTVERNLSGRQEFYAASLSGVPDDFWSKFKTPVVVVKPFNKMFSVPLMCCCFCSFSLILCTTAHNYGIGNPAFLCDSESSMYPQYTLQAGANWAWAQSLDLRGVHRLTLNSDSIIHDPNNFNRQMFLDESERTLTSHYSAARGILATDFVILSHGQVTRMKHELTSPLS